MTHRSFRSRVSLSLTFAATLGVLALTVGSALAAPPAQATNLGPEDQAKQISVTVWLNLHNQAALDTMVQQMYDKTSPNYHQFLTLKHAINDVNVKPVDTLLNVTGLIINPPNTTFESAAFLAQPLENTTRFVSALFQSSSSTRWDVFTFGTDSSLTTGPGWDNVTGLGTPNGAPFIDKVVKAVQ